jgi:lysozyme
MRSVPNQCLELIKRFEGFSSTVYLCPAGVPTIGYGHAVKPRETFEQPMSEDTAMLLLQKDLYQFQLSVQRLITAPLNDNQYSAILSFTYNLGGGALQRSTLRQKLNRGEYETAADEFGKWVFANGRKLKGLIYRRSAEEKLFIAPVEQEEPVVKKQEKPDYLIKTFISRLKHIVNSL